MKKRDVQVLSIPTTLELEKEYTRVKYKFRYRKLLKKTIYTLIMVVAIAVLMSTCFFPVLHIYGESMSPTLKSDDIVLGIRSSNFKRGDVIAFYYNNRILVKRVIAISSDWVNIDASGNVFVNNELLDEAYIEEKAYGDVEIEFPYQVPEGTYFVLGDKRALSVDSRSAFIGTVSKEEIIGTVIFRVWPLQRIGLL